ncbi:MAG: hypothetical protein LLG08_05920 [Actinomycetia bacterium]|nr:hypothetical protein [Actinomycetes bacterium]
MTRARRIVVWAVLLGIAVVLSGCERQGTPQANPNKASSAVLVESPKEYDGTTVTFTGEAIGEAMVRDDKAWIHLNDDAYYLKNVEEGAHLGGYNSGMAVWIDASLAKRIQFFGDYKHEGDVVKISGTFNAACAEHGGDMDIHATSLEIVKPGRDAQDPVRSWKLLWALALALVAAVLYVLNRNWGKWGPDVQQGS